MAPLQDTDTFLLNRSNASYQVPVGEMMAEIQDADLMLVNRSGTSYKVTGTEIKAKFFPSESNPFVETPEILVPDDGAQVDFYRPTFISSQMEGAYIINHYSSTWQVATDAQFNNIVNTAIDSTSALTAYTTTVDLTANTTYYVRVKYRANSASGNESEFSPTVSFTVSSAPVSGGIGASQWFSLAEQVGNYPLTAYGTAITSSLPLASSLSQDTSQSYFNQYGRSATPNASNYVNFTATNSEEIDWPEAGPVFADRRCYQYWGQGWMRQCYIRTDGKVYESSYADYSLSDGRVNVLTNDGSETNNDGTYKNNAPHVTDAIAGIGNYGCGMLPFWSEANGCFYLSVKGTQSGWCTGNPINPYYTNQWFGYTFSVLPYYNCKGSIRNNQNYPFIKPPADRQPGRLPGDVPIRTFGCVNVNDANNAYRVNCILALGEDNKLYLSGSANPNVGMGWNRVGPTEWTVDPSGEEFSWIYVNRSGRNNQSNDMMISGLTTDGRLYVGWRSQSCLKGTAAARTFAEWLDSELPLGDLPSDKRWKSPLLALGDKNEAYAIGSDNRVYCFNGSAKDENNDLGRVAKAVQIGTNADVYSTGIPSWFYKYGFQVHNHSKRDVFVSSSYTSDTDPVLPGGASNVMGMASVISNKAGDLGETHHFQAIPIKMNGGGNEVYIDMEKTSTLTLTANKPVVIGFTGFVANSFNVYSDLSRSAVVPQFSMVNNVGVFKPPAAGTYYWSAEANADLQSDDPALQTTELVVGTIVVVEEDS